ncbi:hypothetical protein, partial [Streptomyces nogalater]
MSSGSTGTPPGRHRLRVLVLLLALWLPGAQAPAEAAWDLAVAAEAVATATGEYDALGTAPRPPARPGHRTRVPGG